jgi:hypothetical protein
MEWKQLCGRNRGRAGSRILEETRDMSEPVGQPNIEAIERRTIIGWITYLTPAQAWGIMVALAVAFSAVAGAAYSTGRNYLHEAQVVAQVDQVKLRFLANYVRYATNACITRDQDKLKESRTLFLNQVSHWWHSQESASPVFHDPEEQMALMIKRNGWDPTRSVVRFRDGDEYLLPPDIKRDVLSGEQSDRILCSS